MKNHAAERGYNSSGNTLILCNIYYYENREEVIKSMTFVSKYLLLFFLQHYFEIENKPQLTHCVIHVKRKIVSNLLSNCSMTEPKLF